MFQSRIVIALSFILLIAFNGAVVYGTLHPDLKNTIWLSGMCTVAILACVRWATYDRGRRVNMLLVGLLLFDSFVHVILYILARAVTV
ncbi:MAG: hypothetical protein NVS2B12_41240 [Ktedonobacteraceae bacterium]